MFNGLIKKYCKNLLSYFGGEKVYDSELVISIPNIEQELIFRSRD